MINAGHVGVNGKVPTTNDSWGHDFILENPLLRHDTLALTLTFAEIETVSIAHLNQVLKVFPSEKRLVGRARAALTLRRGLPRLARLLRAAENTSAPMEVRRTRSVVWFEGRRADAKGSHRLIHKSVLFRA